MELNSLPAIFLIDEEEIVNMINKTVIRRSGFKGEIKDFQSGQDAFDFIQKVVVQNEPPPQPYLILLDLNMPGFSGWDFLNKFLSLSEKHRKQFKISILTSSVNPEDITKSTQFKDVVQFSFKPLTKESFMKIIEVL